MLPNSGDYGQLQYANENDDYDYDLAAYHDHYDHAKQLQHDHHWLRYGSAPSSNTQRFIALKASYTCNH